MTIEELRRVDVTRGGAWWRRPNGAPTRRRRWLKAAGLVALVAAVALAAVGWWYRPTVDVGGTWRVVEADGHVVHGIDATADRPALPYVDFDSIGPVGWVYESDSCTNSGTRYTLFRDRFHVEFGNRTAMACGTLEPGVPDLASMLARTTKVGLQEGVLVLKDSHGVVIMRLTRQSG